jgi:hypothetical protein
LLLPDWTQQLKNYYVTLRMCRRGSALQRQTYRKVKREKLRLAELGISQIKIHSTCKFLASKQCVRNYNTNQKTRLLNLISTQDNQLTIF